MRISPIQTQILNEIRKSDPVARKSASSKYSSASSGTDSVGFSAGAQKLSASSTDTSAAVIAMSAAPDVRQDRIDEVKKRIASGYYNTAEFTDKLADKLAKDFSASPTA